ncbi:MAG: DUF190 domain-containing protein [Mycolicibacterium insubricum]|nr:DUF190 domain-containing protein [Mycobacterium sp.]
MTEVHKLSAYLAERERHGCRFLTEEILELFDRRRVAASVALRGITSFGPRNVIRTDELLSSSEDLPVVLTAVDAAATIAALAGEVADRVTRGLLTVERARVATNGELPATAAETVLMTLLLTRRQRADGVPAHIAATSVLHRLGFMGAVCFLGVDGTIAGTRHRARFFSANTDVPLLVTAIGSRSQVGDAVAELRGLTDRPLIERVQVCKRDGRLLARPHALPGTDADGLELRQKLVVYSDEDARHDGVPIHRALVARLRSAGAAGATVLRGVWGFVGDQPPHGDRLLRLTRRVPVTTVIIDTPAGIAEHFGIVDAITAEHGLVTSEMLPAALLRDGTHCRGGLSLGRHRY